jgi:translation initiation factor IF-1
MPGESAIRIEGTVIEVLKAALLFRVALTNGHRLLGHVSSRHRPMADDLGVGDKVSLEMSRFDFSKGRIILEERQNESSRIS